MKTPLQKLIEQIESLIIDEETYGGDWAMPFKSVKHKAELLLDSEREEIESAFEDGFHAGGIYASLGNLSERYYEETFKPE